MEQFPENNQEIEQEEESTIFAAPVEHNDRKVKTGGRWKKILAAFLAVAILAGGTFAIIKLIPVLDEGSSTSSGTLMAVQLENDDIESVTVNYNGNTLKLSSTIEEWLMSAEYIMAGGNTNIILCERGIRTFETYTRNTLDLSAIPAVKKLSHLPVVVDPSHSAGMSWMVEPLSLAAMAVGADGIIVEVHNDPKAALCDGAQSLDLNQYKNLMDKLNSMSIHFGKECR